MARFGYTLLLYLLAPLFALRQWWRGRGRPDAMAALAARFGFVAPATGRPVWLHCVSVGETVAAEPLVAALRAQNLPLLLTSTTFTGADRVHARLGRRVQHAYMPYDLPDAVARFLDRVQPRALLVLETELWPNLLRACRRRGIPVLLVNARLSARSARGYARFSALSRTMLQDLDCVAAQARADADRFIALGVPAERVEVTGNLKFDLDEDAGALKDAQALRRQIGARPVWVAASTHDGEDDVVLAAHRQLLHNFPDALLVLVPRHPERFSPVATTIARRELAFVTRSSGDVPGPGVPVLLGDSMGEMALYYGIADVAFVGGSLVPAGGHNFLEPAALGLPLLAGPHCFNFQSIADDLAASGALTIIDDEPMLAAQLSAFFSDESRRAIAGGAARAYVEKNRGACRRTLALVGARLGQV